jgi:Carboxypeptidase regulatory-like domain
MCGRALIAFALLGGIILPVSPGALQGLGTVSGIVVDQLDRPLPLSRVHLERVPGQPIDTALADDGGKFSFPRIEPGRYVLRAVRPGYVRPPWVPGEPARMLVVSAGSAQSTPVRLVRGAAISGRVLSPSGTPVSGARVHAMRCSAIGTACRVLAVAGNSVDTDDRGEFRLFGLSPGEYILGAQAKLTGNSEAVYSSVPQLTSWAERMVASRGTTTPSAALSATSSPVQWAMTYFPDAIRPGHGTPIVLRADEEVDGLEIRLAAGRSAAVSGLVSSYRSPSLRSLSFFPDDSVIGAPCGPTVLVQPGGHFRSAACPDGAYRLVGLSEGVGAAPEWAEIRIQLAGSDISDLAIALQPANTVSAVIAVDGAAPDSSVQLSAVGLQLRRRGVGIVVSSVDLIRRVASPTGRVDLVGLLPGDYEASPIGESSSLWARALLSPEGRDVFDDGLTVRQGVASGDLRLELSRRPSLVRGTLTDLEGRPQPSFLVVAVPSEAGLRTGTRRVRTVQVADDGSFEIVGLPDGEYVVGVLGTNDPADLTEELLEEISVAGQRISVAWGTETPVSLRVKLASAAALRDLPAFVPLLA